MEGAKSGGAVGILWELAGDLLRFPTWWYGKGLFRAAKYALEFIQGYARTLGVSVWIKNIFTPMFGRYDWQSRIISVFMRSVNIIGRSFALIIISAIIVGILAAYTILPMFAIIFALYHATSIFAL